MYGPTFTAMFFWPVQRRAAPAVDMRTCAVPYFLTSFGRARTYGIILALKQDTTFFSLKLSPVRYFQIMAATERHEQEMKKKSAELARTATDPLEMLRHKCLARGASGIKGIGRQVSPALEPQCMKSMKYACK